MPAPRPRWTAPVKARQPEPLQPVAISATEAKSRFGQILETAIRGGRVVITRHDAPKAVLMSVAEFNALANAPAAELASLGEEFDRLLAGMQTHAARAAMKAAFRAKPKELGNAAVAAARRRG